ncbi:uncharacterized protein LOC117173615 [Belonocnema kinseyi]|uniref:uncharacterized protein LOC117173615 n=1 Tax=Belonocnema kinseyi TaxID=2817044 RepID=UPI00143DD3CA|nr:uncharacterized protein LOC117173615 [Belonocnema kinseyi]
MIGLQMRPNNCAQPYTDAQKLLAMQWYYYSASCYDRMRQTGLQLPHPRTVEKWVAKYDVAPGFIELSFQDLEKDLKTLPPEAKLCNVKWDEMSCKEFEEYSSKHDLIVGFEDLGPLGITQNRANHVFVFTLNGIHTSYRWRQVVGFFFARHSVNRKNIVILLKMMLDKGEEIGLDIRMTVCDQGTRNIKCYNLLKVTAQKPSFEHNGEQIIFIHDCYHEVTNLVNALLKYGKIFMNGKVLYLSDMKATWDADQRGKLSNNLNHITEVHFYPNSFQKMNVERSRHLFGGKLAKAMIEAHEKGLVVSETLLESAECILVINRLTDAADSNKTRDINPLKSALPTENVESRAVVEDFLSWAPSLKVLGKNGCMKTLPCLMV